MSHVWSRSLLLSRGQIAEISGVSSHTLAFWLRNEILVPSSGGHGSGSHKKFHPIQATIAAIFGKLQAIGLNIAALKAISDIIQTGVRVGLSTNLQPYSILAAVETKKSLLDLELGKQVRLWNVSSDTDKELFANKPEDLLKDLEAGRPEFDLAEDIYEFARKIEEDQFMGLKAFSEIKSAMEGLDWSNPSWLLWQDQHGSWQISSQTEPGEQFSRHPDADTGIFLAMGTIVRAVWNIDLHEIKIEQTKRAIPELLRTNPERADRLMKRLAEMKARKSND
ncbi:MerR family transcriptional regulator [Aurantiacibacter aquimixticola]|uniref:MerR family transcriptional regulator n=1 Tax=Aurantiacibacter aquimixticola TaxID=1958945 RepID=A0A419RU82_9SPHN|nr:MerR family transcriptional regulator [Aurantiacibacter aquimixticola]RJY09353.1 MerR family transcriptional regulator [Aurantiacibacter aquimixticola]